MLVIISQPIYSYWGCVDTDNWVSSMGDDCEYYAKHYCENGSAKRGNEGVFGSDFNYPEKNCCVCGKGKPQGNVIPFIFTLIKLY